MVQQKNRLDEHLSLVMAQALRGFSSEEIGVDQECDGLREAVVRNLTESAVVLNEID